MSSLLSMPPLLPPMDDALEEGSVDKIQGTKCIQEADQNEIKELWSDCNQSLFIEEEDLCKHGDNIMPPLTILKGNISVVPFTQRGLFYYQIHWTNASLLVMFNDEELQTNYFKGNSSLVDMLKQARMNFDIKYADLMGVGPLKLYWILNSHINSTTQTSNNQYSIIKIFLSE